MSIAPKLTETDEASAKSVNSEPISATGALTEREQLEVEKLRREVRELGYHWWQRPQNLSALSSIILSIIGLVWAISNGFFSITRSELEIKKERLVRETSELQKQKEAQLASLSQLRHEVAQARQALLLSEAKARRAREDEVRARSDEKRAKERIADLDKPLLISAFIIGGPWLSARDPEFEINISAINIGKPRGTIQVEMILGCRAWASPQDFYSNKWEIKQWDSTRLEYGDDARHGLVTISFPSDPDSLRAQFRAVSNERLRNEEASGPCEFYVRLHMTRADGKKSVRSIIEKLEGAYSFVYPE